MCVYTHQLGWNRGQTLVPRQICLGTSVFLYLKAQAAFLEQEDVGVPDEEAFFASQEGAKRPTVLAACAGSI
ncbi:MULTISPECIES: hypothetical protein [Bacillus]|uniref:hypothetical protein n=1 Tax=Bacillus TaxID=1386 RepID=UPI0011456070|nr:MULTISPECIES: hypothetical protein [Bacillus]